MNTPPAPALRIAKRFDRLEVRIRRAIEANAAGLLVEQLEHETAIQLHFREIARLSNKYDIQVDMHAVVDMIQHDILHATPSEENA